MTQSFKLPLTVSIASLLFIPAAFAHAFLDHALPAVGGTVTSAPSELQLSFTQNIVPAFSGITLALEGGGAIPLGKAMLDSANPNTLHVKITRALKPGTYAVTWHVVSVDTHPTSGTYKFTVAP